MVRCSDRVLSSLTRCWVFLGLLKWPPRHLCTDLSGTFAVVRYVTAASDLTLPLEQIWRSESGLWVTGLTTLTRLQQCNADLGSLETTDVLWTER